MYLKEMNLYYEPAMSLMQYPKVLIMAYITLHGTKI